MHITLNTLEHYINRPLYAATTCFAAGALAALSMAPANLWPVLFVALPALYSCILKTRSGKGAFAFGWLFGFAYFMFSLSWIGNALLVEGNPYKWAWPLAVSGLPALLAFFTGFSTLVIKKLFNLKSVWGWLGFVSIFCAFEWLRGHLFTGFPWNLMGYAWADVLPMLQILRFSDVYMLTWLTLFWASVPAIVFIGLPHHKRCVLVVGLLSFAGCFLYGTIQLRGNPEYHEDLNIRLVQPNIPQDEKWQSDKIVKHFRKTLQLSYNTDNTDIPTLVVWPETALSYRIYNSPEAQAEIRSMLASYPENSALLTGMLNYTPQTSSYSNALVMIDQDGTLNNIYNKHHLVPFGEYIPFQNWIPLTTITQFQGFERGNGPQTLMAPSGHAYSPLVCYEILFPGKSVLPARLPDFIVNVTNDGWYGRSAGPHQHFTQAVFRAIENGTPVIRAANTGFSAIISPRGHIIGKTSLFEESVQTLRIFHKPSTAFLSDILKTIFFLSLLLATVLPGLCTKGYFTRKN